MSITKRVGPLVENVTESGAACLLTMVQGNVLALGLGHWIIASQTGLAAGFVATVALWASRATGRWLVAGILGVSTGVVDYFVHEGGFGFAAAEAIVTGLGAAALSLAVSTVRARRRIAKA
ncbi:MAG: hypothetical protein AAF389_04510 [Gemmatimonadota bacterium]